MTAGTDVRKAMHLSARRYLAARLDRHGRRVLGEMQYEIEHDIAREDQLTARREAAQWARDNLTGARPFASQETLLRYCIAERRHEGATCEFGVFSGRTVNEIARLVSPLPVHGFDSFEGLPEDWRPGFAKDAFSMSGAPPRVERNVLLHVGWFEKTVTQFCADTPGPIALLHVDCDLYSSTRTVLEGLSDRLVPGTVILFDEYFNFPGWKDHEHRAFTEYAATHGRRFHYLAFNQRGEQVAARIE
jgi:predicted O-methyltransferase YrrM